jgi:hypothetical protein
MFPIFAGNSAATGYNFARSLRFRASATANLTRTFSSVGNRRTWTWSGWVKLGLISSARTLFSANASASSINLDTFSASYEIVVDGVYDGTRSLRYTTAVFRDPAAWYHIVVALDTTQATDTNRIKLYVNGAQVALPNAGVGSWPAQNSQGSINNNIQHCIGQRIFTTDLNFDGYLAEVNFIDGLALTPSSFGSTNALTGVWQPARYTGSYGTNGTYPNFSDNSALTTSSNVGLGKDFSGNGNYWTTNNISITAGVTYDSMTDVPTLTSATAANFAVLNPLYSGTGGAPTLLNGNLDLQGGASQQFKPATISVTTGKWYFEFVSTSGSDVNPGAWSSPINTAVNFPSSTNYRYNNNGTVYNASGSVQSYSSYTTSDIIAVALDMTNGKIYFAKNNTWQGSSDPAAGTNPAATGLTGEWVFGASGNNSNLSVNFGQRPFTYTPPTGFAALNTFNLPTSTIVKGNTVMDATLYTGTGASQAVTNAGAFKPDFAWLKIRSGAANHILIDSVRGVTNYLNSNTTNAEASSADQFLSFNSNGFTVGANTTGGNTNQSGSTYVGWQWQAGQGSTSSNTNGTITSTVSVNASAGFSVVTWTGTGANATVGHGLGVATSLVIVKNRSITSDWLVQSANLTSYAYALILSGTNAQNNAANWWNSTGPTSSVFSVGNGSAAVNGNGNSMVAYCWTPIAGYSAFGSYTGNGSTDGPFVYTGFRPAVIMVKRTDTTGNWCMFDDKRLGYNGTSASKELYPNLSLSEGSSNGPDQLSNGFKFRDTYSDVNASGGTYIYACWAENPFKNSLAR